MKTTTRKAKKKPRKTAGATGMIDFNFGETQYQIDTSRKKVFRNWIEVETAKTFLIMGAYSSSQAQAK